MDLKKTLIAASVAATLGLGMSGQAMADNTTSTINGVLSVVGASANEYSATAYNPKTGLTRTVDVGPQGNFRFAKLPFGVYEVTIFKGDTVVAKDSVAVSLGVNANAQFDIQAAQNIEVLSVVGARINPVDLTTADSGLTINKDSIDMMPVARDFTSIALLAPGTVSGDGKFGSGASFGGSSVAENSCYINGLEVTNTSRGLGCSSVPFEFYKEFQVKTGGYSAKFGRTTGGVMNAVTKSGSNDWEFGASAHWRPAALAAEGQYSRGNGGIGTIFRDTRNDEYDLKDYTVSASGPLIQDTLFIYALVNPRDLQDNYTDYSGKAAYSPVNSYVKNSATGSDNLFWGAKLDWNITDNHALSLFAYSDRSDTTSESFEYKPESQQIGKSIGTTTLKRGGEAKSITYNGTITEDLSITAMYGEIKANYTNIPGNLDCPTVADSRTDILESDIISSCGPGGAYGDNVDTNKQTRVDIEYYLGDHLLKAGYDKQKRDTMHTSAPITGHSWTYSTLKDNGAIQGNGGPIYMNNSGAPMDIVQDRIFDGGGAFSSDLTAYYLEDNWQVTDSLMLQLGLRKDKFENAGVTGLVFSSFDTDIAPRLGFTWDVMGDGASKLFGTYGRYYLPVPNNTNYRSASGVSDTTTYYTFTGHDETGAPTGLTPINGGNSTVVNSIPNPTIQEAYQSEEAEPFAKDEYILGYQQQLTESTTASIKGIYREVASALDDYCGDLASQSTCTILNPGKSATWQLDNDGDSIPDAGSRRTYSAAEIGLPKAENTYKAIETQLQYNHDDLHLTFTYTWSKSEGNFEGAVKSDIGQADPGVTQDFDFPALMDGAYGYQANDRRHVFKLFGTYDVTDDLSLGFNSVLSSGRPLSAFGQGYPSNDPHLYGSYGDTFYLYTGQCPDSNGSGDCQQEEKIYDYVSRGTVGRTPWNFRVDLSANYQFTLNAVDMMASVKVYNVLDVQEITSKNEHYEGYRAEGTQNQYYGAAYDWQTPRYVEFSISARF
ncbi:TonB-dependent receptor [Shewanella sp. YIC-542]|uniref:TonB-dependent receptor n=1 Tax=Shewanella mytili TaxID=3377111 RepID=UPI00398E4442